MRDPAMAARLRYLVIALVVLVVDQLTKWWTVSALALCSGPRQACERYEVLPFFDFIYVRNPGAAFSFLADHSGWQRWFFAAIAIAVSVVLLRWLWRTAQSQPLPSWGCALILGGAIGNLIDRLWHGYVIDFADFFIGNWHYPAFNIADSGICIGAGLLILDSLLAGRRAKES